MLASNNKYVILHLITTTDVGGAELMLERLVSNDQSHKHVVVSLTKIGIVGKRLQEKGFEVYALRLTTLSSIFKVIKELNNLIGKTQPILIQTWLYHSDFIGSIASLMNKIPVIWNIRQTSFGKHDSKATKFLMRICAFASHFIPVKIICAAYASANSHKKFGYAKNKMIVIENGFVDKTRPNIHLINELKQAYNLKPEQITVGVAGRFNLIKDHYTFIEAAAIVSKQFPETRFIMIGRELEWSNTLLKIWIDKHALADKFILMGEQKEVTNALSLIDIFCLTSISEGFPNILGEAMMLAIPCISTDAGDAKHILGDCGEIVEVRNHKGIANAIIKLINVEKVQRDSLGKKSRERIKTHFSMEMAVDKYVNLYRKIKQ